MLLACLSVIIIPPVVDSKLIHHSIHHFVYIKMNKNRHFPTNNLCKPMNYIANINNDKQKQTTLWWSLGAPYIELSSCLSRAFFMPEKHAPHPYPSTAKKPPDKPTSQA